ncbi:testis-expressed protein 2-like isoform X2 [Hemicordylus capensis]|uniref:testis-expressed protein 2-like isoform X2 n=1 Tax=Hemicordylus capensis TaxID=884348 RepID=UPI00230379AE|nr:testis-expressed protein 2-like isoform X2 [Hemicordylus capensis]
MADRSSTASSPSPTKSSSQSSPQQRATFSGTQRLPSQLAGTTKEDRWEGVDGNELIFALDKDEEGVPADSAENCSLAEDARPPEAHRAGTTCHGPSPLPSPPESDFLSALPPLRTTGLVNPQGPKPLINLVKSVSTEIEARDCSSLKPQPLLSLVKSISTEISRQEPEVTQSKSDSKLNVQLWRQITQPKGKHGDSRTAPSSPNISPSESKGSFFKAQEAKFEDTKRRFSEAMQEPLSRLSKIMGDENNVSPKHKGPLSGNHAHDSPSSHSREPILEDETEDSGHETDHHGAMSKKSQAEGCFPGEQKWGPSLNCRYEICSYGDVIQVVEVAREKNGGSDHDVRAIPTLGVLHPTKPCCRVPCKTLACVAILAYNYLVLPLPPYVSGLFLGLAGGFMLGFLMILLLVPKCSRSPRKTQPPRDKLLLGVPNQLLQDPNVMKGWMNEMYSYDPEIYHPSLTHSVFVTLEDSTLKLSYPKNNIPRRATFEEEILEAAFVSHRHYEMSGTKVFLFPPGLARKRMWNKKYPICVLFPDHDELLGSKGPSEHDMDPSREKSMKRRQPAPGQEGPLKTPADPQERTLYLFGRTGRDKEEWFQHLVKASQAEGYEPHNAHQCEIRSASDSSPPESPGPSTAGSPTPKKFLRDVDVSSEPYVAWANAVLGRMFWDFLREKYWADQVSNKIQKKLGRIKLPYFMNELTLTDLDMGTSIPHILSASSPTLDKRGLWVDMEVTYNGALQMTLETKMNLCKLGKEALGEESGKADNVGEGVKPRLVLLANSDAESSSAGSSDEEDPPTMEPSGTPGERNTPPGTEGHVAGNSTSRKILRFVDKIAKSKYFQKATENEFIKKKIEEVSNTPLLLTVEVQELTGTLTVNIPPPPTDRVWYSFRIPPQLDLKVRPKLGEREVTFIHVTEWIERKLQHEFQKILVMPNMDDLILPLMHSGPEPQLPMEGLQKDFPGDGEKKL